ncbi:SGNH/GDSL hydrolase family protein [soil metagenome]
MKASLVVIALGAAQLADAGPKPLAAAPSTLEDPCTDGPACKHHALDSFRTALAAQRSHDAVHPLRVSWFGDSLTADDQLTNGLRHRLARLVGDGGPGFVFAAPPHPFCQHRALSRTVSDEWTVHGISAPIAADRLLGLGGSTETETGGTLRFVPTSPVTSVDLHYLAQPSGGSLELVADNKLVTTLETRAPAKKSMFLAVELPVGTRAIELRARGRVRLFGAAFEAKAGAVVDNLGIVNATAKAMHDHNMPEHWRNQLAHRAPDLVVIMYGTNEAEWIAQKGASLDEHERLFGEILATVRAAVPDAACLVISPLDQLDWQDAKLAPRASIPSMVEAHRRAATAHGCAFWDTYAWMGGRGSSAGWFKHGLIVKDFQHPTSEGAERIAEALFAGLTN